MTKATTVIQAFRDWCYRHNCGDDTAGDLPELENDLEVALSLRYLRPATEQECLLLTEHLHLPEDICILVPLFPLDGVSEELWSSYWFCIRRNELQFLQDLASKGDTRYLQYDRLTTKEILDVDS